MSGAAIILAAGESRRMGRVKQILEVGGEALVARMVRLAREAGLAPCVVVLGANRARVAAALDDDVECVYNSEWSEGMGSSLQAGIRRLRALDVPRVTITPCDLPLLRAEELARLDEALATSGAEVAAAQYDGLLGAPACFASGCFERLLAMPPGQGARALLRGGVFDVIAVPTPGASFDLDRPTDLEQLREHLDLDPAGASR